MASHTGSSPIIHQGDGYGYEYRSRSVDTSYSQSTVMMYSNESRETYATAESSVPSEMERDRSVIRHPYASELASLGKPLRETPLTLRSEGYEIRVKEKKNSRSGKSVTVHNLPERNPGYGEPKTSDNRYDYKKEERKDKREKSKKLPKKH
jgi:hypothetical protein